MIDAASLATLLTSTSSEVVSCASGPPGGPPLAADTRALPAS